MDTARMELPLDEQRDVIVKFDMIGDEYSLSAWNAGDEPRELPLISDKDSQLRQGVLGVSLFAEDSADIAYRWIELAEIRPGDVDTNGTIDVDDIDFLTAAVNDRSESNRFDTDRDGDVDADDRTTWVHDIKQTWFGDANLDGEFNSGDFVSVFQVGKYETGDSASWAEGDWDGDGKFTSSDFMVAFQDGGFEAGPKGACNARP